MLASWYHMAAALVAIWAVCRGSSLPVLIAVGVLLGVTTAVRISSFVVLAALAVLFVAKSRTRAYLPLLASGGVTVVALTAPFLAMYGKDWDPLTVGGIAGSVAVQYAVMILAIASLALVYLQARRLPDDESVPGLARSLVWPALSMLPLLLSAPQELYRASSFLLLALPWLCVQAVAKSDSVAARQEDQAGGQL
jgi:hypothetical protein